MRYWDVRTGTRRLEQTLTFDSEILQVAFGPRFETVLVRSGRRVGGGRAEVFQADASARLWDVGLQDKRRQWVVAHPQGVSAVSFSPDGRRLLSTSGDVVSLVDAETGKPLATLTHDESVVTAAFDAGGTAIITSSSDGTARVWDANTGVQRFAAKHKDSVGAAMLLAGGQLLATMSASTARLWTVASGVAEIGAHIFEMPDDGDPTDRDVWRDNFSPDGRLAVSRDDKIVTIRDVASGKTTHTLPHDGFVRIAAFVGDGRALATSGDENVARVWDVATGTVRYTLEHSSKVTALAVSPDGRTLLTVQEGGPGHLWDATTGKERFALSVGCNTVDARFIAGGTLAVVWSRYEAGGSGCPVMVWDAATGAPRSSIATGEAHSIGFSENATVLFGTESSGFSGAPPGVRVWDLDTGEERFQLPLPSEGVRSVAVSPDGRRIAIAADTGLSAWAIGGDLLQSILAASTTVCLQPEFRRQNLGESAADATRAYDACERRHGRK